MFLLVDFLLSQAGRADALVLNSGCLTFPLLDGTFHLYEIKIPDATQAILFVDF